MRLSNEEMEHNKVDLELGEQNIKCILCIRTMVFHMVGYSLQVTASMK